MTLVCVISDNLCVILFHRWISRCVELDHCVADHVHSTYIGTYFKFDVCHTCVCSVVCLVSVAYVTPTKYAIGSDLVILVI